MRIDKRYKVWLAAATEKSDREVLQHVLIEKTDGEWSTPDGFKGPKGVAVAGNGFMLGVVPVELDEEDVPGLVQAHIFQQAHRGIAKHNAYVELILRDTQASFLGKLGMMHCDRRNSYMKQYPDIPFPNWRGIVPPMPDMDSQPKGALAILPSQLKDMADVLGIEVPIIIRTAPQNTMQDERGEGPLILRGPSANGSIEPPYGLLMPHWGR